MVYELAQKDHPEIRSKAPHNWSLDEEVWLNPVKPEIIENHKEKSS